MNHIDSRSRKMVRGEKVKTRRCAHKLTDVHNQALQKQGVYAVVVVVVCVISGARIRHIAPTFGNLGEENINSCDQGGVEDGGSAPRVAGTPGDRRISV